MEGPNRLAGRRVLLGVSGSIAAYKAVDILRRMQEQGAEVTVVLTRNAERFVSRLTFQTLSGNPVPGVEFQDWEQPTIGHIDVTEGIDAALVAPATANVIGKAASGIADDTLTTALLALDCPLIMAPAMNDRMFRNAIVQRNMALLREQGVRFVEPGTGALACGTIGRGRLADTALIVNEVCSVLAPCDLSGTTVLVTAGPTREQIDAVRYISNPSTGKMGFALAAAARARGAKVILVAGPTEITPPSGLTVVKVTSAADMGRAVKEYLPEAGVVIMAAAVSDFKPAVMAHNKIKKSEAPTVLELERTEDILASLGSSSTGRLLVGFAAETDHVEANAAKKIKDKNLDLIIANDLHKKGAGFGTDTNSVIMIDRSGAKMELPVLPKTEIARRIIDKIVELKKK